jgi:peptidyl-prolyl cis-trans isomerase SurA
LRLLFIIILTGVLLGQEKLDQIAAVVNDEIILSSEIEQSLMAYMYQNKLDLRNDPQKMAILREQILEQMLEQKILLVKAAEDTVEIDEDEVQQNADRHFSNILRQVGSEQNLTAMYNMPLSRIKRFIAKNIREQMLVERVKGQLMMSVTASRREVENFYKQNSDSLPLVPETAELAHIVRTVRPSQSALDAAKRKADSLYNALNEGADFSALAQAYSQDPGSAANGGDLGFTKQGDFVKPFEEAAFALSIMEISEPVLSDFGYHIIQLLDKRGERIRTRHILIGVQPTNADVAATKAFLNDLKAKIMADSVTFEEAALTFSDDPNVQSDKGQIGLFQKESISIPEFRQVLDILREGQISDPFLTRFGAHILWLKKLNPERRFNLEDDYDEVKNLVIASKRESVYRMAIDDIKARVPIQIKLD